MSHLLDTSDYFTYEKTEICKGIEFEIYRDDYGMSYFLAWRDPQTNKVKEWCCGTCNDYHWDMEDIADYILEQNKNNEGNSNEQRSK